LFMLPFYCLLAGALTAQDMSLLPPQLEESGLVNYVCDSVAFSDFADTEEGYWLFEPASPTLSEAPVVVFVHGYGGYNPMIYGAWIRHLVRQGNIVIYPRYQKNLFSPGAEQFVPNAARGILDALEQLQQPGHVRPIPEKMAYVGHSYGGVISANLAIHYEDYGVPKPQAVMLCSPGSGRLSGGVLESYEAMPPDILLLIMVSVNDRVVGEEFGRRVFAEAIHTPNRNLLVQYPDERGEEQFVTAGHNESYAPDLAFDTGMRNVTAKRALRIGRVDAIDWFGYWKLFDALLACSREGAFCDTALGDTPEQCSLGCWINGEPIRPLDIFTPEDGGSN
jgi:acetyl esterase/lipase